MKEKLTFSQKKELSVRTVKKRPVKKIKWGSSITGKGTYFKSIIGRETFSKYNGW
jgi:hypothetical protein